MTTAAANEGSELLTSLANQAYELLFSFDDSDDFVAARTSRDEAQAGFEQDIEFEKKRRQPKRRKRFDDLPEDVMDRLRAKWMASAPAVEYAAALSKAQAWRRHAKRLLDMVADDVDVETSVDREWTVKEASEDSYRSQTQPSFYARGELAALQDALEAIGAKCRVTSTRGPGAGGGRRHQLRANVPPWAADAINRRITVDEWIASCEKRSLNPRVYAPLLPYGLSKVFG